jgi:drug/metabolite transporter (DMT)-like permease
LWTVSVALNGASVATVLAYGSTAFTAVLGWRLFEEQLGIVKIMVVLVCLTGCFLVAGAYDLSEWQVNPLGLISGLLTGLGFAIFSLMGRASSNRKINPWTATLYVFGIASLFLLLYSVFADWLPNGMGTQKVFWLGDKWIGWVLLFILSAGPTAGGFGLYTVSLTYLPASVVNLIATLEPVLTVILAFILLGERLTFVQLIGSALIIIAIVSLRLYEGNSLKKTANAAVI